MPHAEAADAMKRAKPKVIELDTKKLEKALDRAESALGEEDYETFKALVDSYSYLTELVGDKSTTIRRLRKLLFGSNTEKTDTVLGDKADASPSSSDDDDSDSSDQSDPKEDSTLRFGAGWLASPRYQLAPLCHTAAAVQCPARWFCRHASRSLQRHRI